MPVQATAQVTLNGSTIPVVPGITDNSGDIRGERALSVAFSVELDAGDMAAILLMHLTEGATTAELVDDSEAWAVIADRLVNDGLGTAALNSARHEVAYDVENPYVAWSKLRVANLLSAETDGRDIGSVVPFPSRPTATRESVAMSR